MPIDAQQPCQPRRTRAPLRPNKKSHAAASGAAARAAQTWLLGKAAVTAATCFVLGAADSVPQYREHRTIFGETPAPFSTARDLAR